MKIRFLRAASTLPILDFRSLLLCRVAIFAAIFAATAAAKERPNIILILADDMGYDSVSVNNPEMGPLKTPHIDHLATQGMNFHDAHSGSAVCTPTRYGLLTGRYCWRTELKKEVLWDYGRPLIEPGRLTLPTLLRHNGYTTGMIGKWHLGLDCYDANGNPANADLKIDDAVWKPGEGAERVRACAERIDFTKPIGGGPLDHGFDMFFGVDLPSMPPYAWIEGRHLTAQPTAPKPDEMFGTEGPMVPGWKLEEILPELGKRSAEWIREQAPSDDPFFLFLSLTSPHTPISPSEPFQGKSGISDYADFIIETDAIVGQVMEALEASGEADNTLVIFTTDNGTAGFARFGQLEEHGVDLRHTFKGIKGQLHEGGHRVPFIVRWPGRVPAGSTSHGLICLNDIIATTAELLGTTLPDGAAEDSTSILKLITGKAAHLPDRPPVVHHNYQGEFAIRQNQWKLVGDELYNLETDPKESTDLAAKHPEIVKQLSAALTEVKR